MISENNIAKTQYFKELSLVLKRSGFSVVPRDDGQMSVWWGGEYLCRVNGEGEMWYRQEDMTTPDREDAGSRALAIAMDVRDYMRAMEQAPELRAEGLESGYKLLADFGGSVLSGKQTRYGVNFVTWEWATDRTGVAHGHYHMEDYAAAKRDFAVRSGLVAKDELFSPEQLTEVYRCVHETLESGNFIRRDQQDILCNICQQIAYSVPDLEERLELAKQQDLEQAPSSPTMKYPQF